MSYQAQLEAKTAKLRRAMNELGCCPERVASVTGLRTPFGYRTKLQMSASGSAGALRFGFYRRGSMAVVPAEGCPVQHPQALAVLATVRQALDAQRICASRGRGQQGWLHALSIRVDPQSMSSELILSGRTARIAGGKPFIDQLARIPTVRSIHLCSMPARSSYPIEPPFKRLAGRRRMMFHLAEHRTSLSPGTFFQTSSEGAALLAREVEKMLPAKMELFADLYGGAGLFALLTRERWRRAIVVEESESAISDLNHALTTSKENKRAAVLPGRVEHRIEEVLAKKPDVVLLDPPRKGCHGRVIEAMLEHRPDVVLYVACGFSSLMRDGRLLIEGGYRAVSVAAVDMFPHTPQLEVIVRFEP
jgi:23S rRNA (uracil1939-C5)-methyltransferase